MSPKIILVKGSPKNSQLCWWYTIVQFVSRSYFYVFNLGKCLVVAFISPVWKFVVLCPPLSFQLEVRSYNPRFCLLCFSWWLQRLSCSLTTLSHLQPTKICRRQAHSTCFQTYLKRNLTRSGLTQIDTSWSAPQAYLYVVIGVPFSQVVPLKLFKSDDVSCMNLSGWPDLAIFKNPKGYFWDPFTVVFLTKNCLVCKK